MKRKQKNDFISKLAFYLSFHYSDEEQKSIINDYDDWFKNEMGMGKEYAQVCEELGTPRKIVNNLLSEESKHISNIHTDAGADLSPGFRGGPQRDLYGQPQH